MSDEKVKEILYQKNINNYGGSYRKDMLEIYKIYVASADAISQRRQNANAYFLSVNTGLIAVFGLTSTCIKGDLNRLLCLISIAGIVMSYTWYRLIKSYRGLNSGKFKVIHLIEKKLPIAPYDAEWEAVGRGKNKKKHLPFTHVETFVPWIFLTVYLAALMAGIFQWLATCPITIFEP